MHPTLHTRTGGTAYQNAGAQIMQVADALLPVFEKQFEGCHDENGMPVQRGRLKGIALIAAQKLVKTEPRMSLQEMGDVSNPLAKHRVESLLTEAFIEAGVDEFTAAVH